MTPPKSVPKAPLTLSDVTPEQALAAIERTITECGGMWAKGPRVFACKTAGQRLANALTELHAAEAHAKALRDGMASLVKEAIDAVAGTTTPKAPKATAQATNGAVGVATGVAS